MDKEYFENMNKIIIKINKQLESINNKNTLKSMSFFYLCDIFLKYKKNSIAISEVDSKKVKFNITEQRYKVLNIMVRNIKKLTFNFDLSKLNYSTYYKLINCEGIKVSHHCCINQIINFAYKQELIKSKSFIISPNISNYKITNKFLESDEIYEIFKNNLPLEIELLIKILLETGIRIGEFLALDINKDIKKYRYNGETIYSMSINKTYSLTLKKILNNTKNKKSREIGINKTTYNNIIELFDFLKNTKKTFSYEKILRELKKIKIKSDKNITPHIFRHTHASILAEKNFSLQIISDRLGDTSDVVKRIYIHITKVRINNDIILFNNFKILDKI